MKLDRDGLAIADEEAFGRAGPGVAIARAESQNAPSPAAAEEIFVRSRAYGLRLRTLAAVLLLALGAMQGLLLLFLGKPAISTAVLIAALVPGGRAAFTETAGDIGKTTIGWRRIAACLAVALLVFVLGGEGRFFYANTDWQVRNAVLLDLVREPWPFTYAVGSATEILRAPLGIYLGPALVGKLAGFRAAELALLAQNTLLLGALLAVGSTLFASTRACWVAVGVFFGFSGMDIVGQIITHRPIWLHLEQWAGIQFSANLTQAFWVPQHALAGWIFALFYMLWREDRTPAWLPLAVVPLSALLSPLAMMGMIPFAAHIGIETLAKRRLRWADIVLPGVALIASAPALVYLTTDGGSVGSHVARVKPLIYVTFILLEIWIYVFALWQVRERMRFGKVTAAIVVAVLLIAPLVRVGQSVDFVMRATIPALAILSIMVADLLVHRATEGDGSWKMARRWALIAFAVGLATPVGEVVRAVLLPRAPGQLCGYYGVVPGGYATYVAPYERLPSPLRSDAAVRIVPSEPARCWDGAWPDAATGKGW
jgi:hypothetical protein